MIVATTLHAESKIAAAHPTATQFFRLRCRCTCKSSIIWDEPLKSGDSSYKRSTTQTTQLQQLSHLPAQPHSKRMQPKRGQSSAVAQQKPATTKSSVAA